MAKKPRRKLDELLLKRRRQLLLLSIGVMDTEREEQLRLGVLEQFKATGSLTAKQWFLVGELVKKARLSL
jgi:hypothetical protein